MSTAVYQNPEDKNEYMFVDPRTGNAVMLRANRRQVRKLIREVRRQRQDERGAA